MIEISRTYSGMKNMEGFELEISNGTVTIGKGTLIVNEVIQKFDETIFELDTTDHYIYDLYIVRNGDGFSYHLDQTHINSDAFPSYTGDLELFHTFLTIETQDGQFKGSAVYLKPSGQGLTSEGNQLQGRAIQWQM